MCRCDRKFCTYTSLKLLVVHCLFLLFSHPPFTRLYASIRPSVFLTHFTIRNWFCSSLVESISQAPADLSEQVRTISLQG